jgi:hypothetical protein
LCDCWEELTPKEGAKSQPYRNVDIHAAALELSRRNSVCLNILTIVYNQRGKAPFLLRQKNSSSIASMSMISASFEWIVNASRAHVIELEALDKRFPA